MTAILRLRNGGEGATWCVYLPSEIAFDFFSFFFAVVTITKGKEQ